MTALRHERERVREARILLGQRNLKQYGITNSPVHIIPDVLPILVPRSRLVSWEASRFMLECGYDPITGVRIRLVEYAAPLEEATARLSLALQAIMVTGGVPKWKAPAWTKGDYAWLERNPDQP